MIWIKSKFQHSITKQRTSKFLQGSSKFIFFSQRVRWRKSTVIEEKIMIQPTASNFLKTLLMKSSFNLVDGAKLRIVHPIWSIWKVLKPNKINFQWVYSHRKSNGKANKPECSIWWINVINIKFRLRVKILQKPERVRSFVLCSFSISSWIILFVITKTSMNLIDEKKIQNLCIMFFFQFTYFYRHPRC